MKAKSLLIPLAAASFILTAAAWFILPGQIPLHWDASGEIDSWGGKANILWIAGLPLALAILLRVFPRIDPNGGSYRRHAAAWESLSLVLCLGLMALGWVTVAAGLGLPIKTGSLIRIVVGLLFAGLGNSLGKLRRNWFFGIRTPWTLASDESWRLTHRRGGFVFVGLGLLFIAAAFLPGGPALNIIVVTILTGAMVYLVAYSWWIWRKEGLRPPKGPAAP